jgi:GT2 family glycosyltransferase
MPRYLEVMGAALAANPFASIAYTQAWILDDRTRRIHKRTTGVTFQPGPAIPPDDPELLMQRLVRGNFVFVSAAVRRTAILEVGGFDTQLGGTEDYDLWLRLAARGHRMVRVVEPLAVYRRRRGSLSDDSLAMSRRLTVIYERVAADASLSHAVRDAAQLQAAESRRTEERLARDLDHRLTIRRARRRLEAGLRRALWWHSWRLSHPDEVASAYPQLSIRRGRSKLVMIGKKTGGRHAASHGG